MTLRTEVVIGMYRSSLYRCTEAVSANVPKWSCTDLVIPLQIAYTPIQEIVIQLKNGVKSIINSKLLRKMASFYSYVYGD